MKKINIIIALMLACVLLTGCASTSGILDEAKEEYTEDLNLYIAEHDGEIPKSVLDTLDFMLENYTGGLEKPDISEIEKEEIDDEDEISDIIGDATEEASDRDKVKELILAALTNTEPDVTFRIDTSLFSDELLYEIIFDEITAVYIIEGLGINSYSYSYTQDVTTGEYVVRVNFQYFTLSNYSHNFTLEQIKQMKIDLKAKAEELVKTLNLKSLSEYEVVEAVNRYLCDTITYSAGSSPYLPMQHTPYGALMNGDCVCEGYAKAAQLLFSMCGLESYYVTGDAGGGHAWNIVKVDGEYYQLDITWNDVDSCPNQYFLVTDDYMDLSRTWDKSRFPKSARSPYDPNK